MKNSMIILIVIGVIFFASVLGADNTLPASYYYNYITMKIAKCEQQASMINAGSDCVRRCAKTKALQAKFLREHKAKLVENMVAENIAMKPYKVDYFLIKAFFDANQKTVAVVIK